MYTTTYVFKKSFFFFFFTPRDPREICNPGTSPIGIEFFREVLRAMPTISLVPTIHPPQEEIFFELCHANQFLRTATCATFYLASFPPFLFDSFSTIRGSERNRYARYLHYMRQGREFSRCKWTQLEGRRNQRSNVFFLRR